ncbi:Uroporphyrinogen III decarboxylase [invertebrate metagenome]|uniref:uroporphyrinogen decarboxylase n=1 Tax=invertebrate metagenome TaxID=1711999 RepID=A0A484H618_9ZZZZ
MPLHSPCITTVKPLLRALQGETVIPPPLWLMRQAGRYLPEYRHVRASVHSFLELCYSPELAAEVALQPIRRYGFDAAILFSDILVVPDALGQPLVFHEGKGPTLERLECKADVTRLSLDQLTNHLTPVYKTVQCLASTIAPTVALLGFAGAPWTVAAYMIEGGGSKDFSQAKLWALGKGPLEQLMELLTEATTQHLLAQIAAGAEAVQVFDTWAGVLPESEFSRLIIKPTENVVRSVHRVYPDVPIIAFPRGAGAQYEAFVTETGVQAVSIDSSVPLMWAASRLQPHVAIQGNLDPLALVAGGESMLQRVHRIVDILSHGPFVFNLGHGIVPETPLEHVAALVEYVRICGQSEREVANRQNTAFCFSDP